MKNKFVLFFILLFTVGTLFAGDIEISYMGVKLTYSWSSDASRASDAQIKSAVEQGLKEGYNDGLLDKNSSRTTHYGDSYSQYSFKNSYLKELYHDAYMEGYKKGAGKPPSVDDLIWW